ncbi:MAG: hypothetical protein Q8P38_00750 [Candidatus Nanopelagicales bacterium]|nr:hypothetical protein [Candidatus Nanopelagicales bacterium]
MIPAPMVALLPAYWREGSGVDVHDLAPARSGITGITEDALERLVMGN